MALQALMVFAVGIPPAPSRTRFNANAKEGGAALGHRPRFWRVGFLLGGLTVQRALEGDTKEFASGVAKALPAVLGLMVVVIAVAHFFDGALHGVDRAVQRRQ